MSSRHASDGHRDATFRGPPAEDSRTITMRHVSTPSRLVPAARELTPAAFAPFGTVVQNPLTHGEDGSRLQRVEANQGSATKWLDVTHVDNHYGQAPSTTPAKAVMNMFVCKPRELATRNGQPIFPVKILERHPYTPQTFVPVGVSRDDVKTRYLVIVAPTVLSSASDGRTPKGPGDPDLANLRAFIVRGDQAVTYGPGTWHAPMVVLGERAIDFVVVQYANGVALEDCQEVEIVSSDVEDGLAVAVDDAVEADETPAVPGIMRGKL